MVKLNVYNSATGNVETVRTWVKPHRAWSHAYRAMTRLVANDRTTETIYYLTGV